MYYQDSKDSDRLKRNIKLGVIGAAAAGLYLGREGIARNLLERFGAKEMPAGERLDIVRRMREFTNLRLKIANMASNALKREEFERIAPRYGVDPELLRHADIRRTLFSERNGVIESSKTFISERYATRYAGGNASDAYKAIDAARMEVIRATKAHPERFTATTSQLAEELRASTFRQLPKTSKLRRFALGMLGMSPMTWKDMPAGWTSRAGIGYKEELEELVRQSAAGGNIGNIDDILVDPWIVRVGGKTYNIRNIREEGLGVLHNLRDNFQIPVVPGAFSIRAATLFPWLSIKDKSFYDMVSKYSNQPFVGGVEKDIVFSGKEAFGINWGANTTAEQLDGSFTRLMADSPFVKRVTRNLVTDKDSTMREIFFAPESIFGRVRSIFTKYENEKWVPKTWDTMMSDAGAEPSRESLNRIHRMLYLDGKIDEESYNAIRPIFENSGINVSELDGLFGAGSEDNIAELMSDYGHPVRTRELSDALQRWQTIGRGMFNDVEAKPDYSFANADGLFGIPDPLSGADILRKKLIYEAIAGVRDTNLIDDAVKELGTKNNILSLTAAAKLDYMLEEEGLDNAWAFLRGGEGYADNIRKSVKNAIGRNYNHLQLGPFELEQPNYGSEVVMMRDSKNIVEEINRSIKASWCGDKTNITPTSLWAPPGGYFWANRINEMFSEFGIGLKESDLGSSREIMQNILLKRVLPGMAVVEAWKYLNYSTDQKPRGFLANLRANIGLDVATLEEFTGITAFEKRMIDLVPGLDMYLHPQTREEREDYYREGQDAVRGGRLWLTGSRQAWIGGKVRYFRPNWYQLQTTWPEGVSEQEYFENAAFPTLQYPMAPVRHFITDPYSWERAHASDRPYPVTAPLATEEAIWGPLVNNTVGRILKPQRLMHTEYLSNENGGKLSQSEMERINTAIKNNADTARQGSIAFVNSAGQVQPVSPVSLGPGGGWEPEVKGDLSYGAGAAYDESLISEAGDRGGIAAYPAVESKRSGLFGFISKVLHKNGDAKFDVEGLNDAIKYGTNAVGGVMGMGGDPLYSDGVYDPRSIAYQSRRAWYSFSDYAGLYGWGATLAMDNQWREPVLQSAGRATSYEHRFWDAELGGAGGGMCLLPDVLVQAGFGSLIPASGVSIGDTLISKDGVKQNVRLVHKRLVDEDIRVIACYGAGIPIKVTGEHPIYAIRSEYCEHKDGRKGNYTCHPSCSKTLDSHCNFEHYKNYKTEWIPAKYIKRGDYIAYPKIKYTQTLSNINILELLGDSLGELEIVADKVKFKNSQGNAIAFPSELELTQDLGKFFGFYLSEGSFGHRNAGRLYEVNYSFDRDEEEFATFCRDFILQFGINACADSSREGYWRFRCCNRILSEVIFKLFGWKDTKKIPELLLGAPKEFLYGLLEGLIKGDGHCRSDIENKIDIKLELVAKDTISQVFNILIMLDYMPSISLGKKPGRFVNPKGYACKTKQKYNIRICGNNAKRLAEKLDLKIYGDNKKQSSFVMPKAWGDDNHIYFMVSENYPEHYEGLVYDFTMDGDPSFCTSCMAVHNSEVFRRILTHRFKQGEEINPIPNDSMPDWMPKNYFIDYFHGDPFVKQPLGELRLPGEAYSKLHGITQSPEEYSDLDRLRVLADIAPWSREYKAELNLLRRDPNTPDDVRTEIAGMTKRVAAMKKRYMLYPRRFGHLDLKTRLYMVDHVIDANTIETVGGTILRLAGVRASNERAAAAGIKLEKGEEASSIWKHYDIHPGSVIVSKTEADPQFADVNDVLDTRHAVIYVKGKNVNHLMLKEGVATEKKTDWSDTGVLARFSYGERLFGNFAERIAHLDNPISTKLWHVRTPLEEYKRGMVYGKESGSWDAPVRDYLIPSIESAASHDPITAGLMGGFLASLFVRYRGAKIKAFQYGAIAGAGLSLLRKGTEIVSGEKWIPTRRRKEREVIEYFDTLKYLKFANLYAKESELAKEEEGFDVEKFVEDRSKLGEQNKSAKKKLADQKRKITLANKNLQGGMFQRFLRSLHVLPKGLDEWWIAKHEKSWKERVHEINEKMAELSLPQQPAWLGEHATRALAYKSRMEATMYGADPATNYVGALSAIPKWERELIPGFIKSSRKERKEIYALLPTYEKRLLGPMLGIKKSKTLKKPDLGEYFATHTLPGTDWEGWSEQVNLDDVRAQVIGEYHLDPIDFSLYPQEVQAAKMRTENVRIPMPKDMRQKDNIATTLKELLSGKGLTDIRVTAVPTDGEAQVNVRVSEDPHNAIKNGLNNLGRAVI